MPRKREKSIQLGWKFDLDPRTHIHTHSREHALTKIETNRVDEYEERKNRSGKKKDVSRKIDKRGKVRMKAKGNKQARE